MAKDTQPIVLKLIREPFREDCTRGTLLVPWGSFYTIERPWLDNKNGVSCIPEGTYQCAMRWSNSFKRDLYGVKSVPDRKDILIHNGSYMENSLGCILIGKTCFTAMNNGVPKRGIGLSRVGLEEFLQKMNKQPFTLEITRMEAPHAV